MTRREFAARTAAVAATLAAGAMPAAAPLQGGPDARTALDRLEEKLGSRLPDDVRPKAEEALKSVAATSRAREKHRLLEGSEPGTIYVPTPAPKGVRK